MFLIEWLGKLLYGEEAWKKANQKRVKPRRRRK